MHEADQLAVEGQRAGQPVAAIRQRALAPRLHDHALWPAHVDRGRAVDGVGAVVGGEAAIAAIGALDRHERRVGFRARGPAHDLRGPDPDRQAFRARHLRARRDGGAGEQRGKKERAHHDSEV
jgi:hypothetical protein